MDTAPSVTSATTAEHRFKKPFLQAENPRPATTLSW